MSCPSASFCGAVHDNGDTALGQQGRGSADALRSVLRVRASVSPSHVVMGSSRWFVTRK